jgi:hypothetical protein
MWHHLANIKLSADGEVKIICGTHDNLRVLSEMLLYLHCSEVKINFSLFTVIATLPTWHYVSRNHISRIWHQIGRDADWYLTLLERSKATATSQM